MALKINKKDFINKDLADAVEALIKLEPEYEARKQGNILAAQLLQLAQTFREDRGPILGMFDNAAEEAMVTMKQKQILNPQHKPTRFVKPYNEFAKPESTSTKGCAGCGKKITQRVGSDLEQPENKNIPQDIKTLKLSSYRDVLNGFNGDIVLMENFCDINRIDILNAKNATDIAKAIFKYWTQNIKL